MRLFFPLVAVMLLLFLDSSLLAVTDEPEATCVILTGLGGVPEYEENFEKWGQEVQQLCAQQVKADVHFLDGRETGRSEILKQFEELTSRASEQRTLWLFMIGHASYDGRDYKFNIKGPDLTGRDLEAFLDAAKAERVFAVIATSSSGYLLTSLAAPNRVIVTATKSEREKRPPLFMSFFLEGAESAEADINKDKRVSLQEVFDFASAGVAAWYAEKGRLQTEHPLLDNADGRGGLASIAYLSSPPEQAYRTLEAQELAPQRVRLEREIEDLKLRKGEMPAAEYYAQLEKLLVDLAELNERISQLEGSN